MDDDVDAQDTPAEVDATFRTLRRVGVGYFVVFLVAVIGFPALSLTLDWWSESRVLGGMSPGFLLAALGLYVFFAVLGVAAARLSTAVEARMLGGTADEPDDAHDDATGHLPGRGPGTSPDHGPSHAPSSAPGRAPSVAPSHGPGARPGRRAHL
ncbi:hypothetical protein LEP48_08410 [Isoptericola sp. NEAU-Y5]|uniref:Uncharacterized protein n=1 Tax=Isoptericola luteus TaxID=2879484 RepID=A0ABS7ZE98_9MICO|nr:hypothetical protein [Isoptericola sp. NEAU-Y5]MCA5893373.1 hypothetical protein [Isoptericola sp. NEAU-Y5]